MLSDDHGGQMADTAGPSPDRTYTRDQVSAAVNSAAELVLNDEELFPYEDSDSIRIHTFIDLVVNAAMSLLDDPGMSLDDVMNSCWQADDPDEDAAPMVRGWLA